MPTFYNFRENGLDYSFDDIFVPVDLFRAGNLWTWGNGTFGRLGNATTTSTNSTPVTTFTGGTDWKQVSTGSIHTSAIKTDGTLWTWGNGTNGRLGTNDVTNRSTPVTTFSGGTNWKQVSSGDSHTAAIKTDGTLWTWGSGSSGELGTNNTIDELIPVTTFAGGTNWKQVSAGYQYTAAIKTNETLWTWGNSFFSSTSRSQEFLIPITTFAGGTNWSDTPATTIETYILSSGDVHTAAIKTDGTLWTWGFGSFGVLGNAVTTDVSTPVTTFAGGTNWKQISSGSSHTAAIKTDGTLWIWGSSGSSGLLGNARTTLTNSTPVTTFAGGTNWKQVSSGRYHTSAIKTDGTLWTWGYGYSGQLGNARTTFNNSTPATTFTGGTDWKQVSSGDRHTAAIKTDGTLWTWGLGTSGQIGNATITSTNSTPVTTFSGGTDWKQVSCGGFSFAGHTAAIKTDGTLWTWGNGTFGVLGNAVTTDVSTPVTTFTGGTNWKQVSNGREHTAAIKTDGTLWTWGNGNFGRLGNAVTTSINSTPSTTFSGGTNWKQVSSGGYHTIALKGDGVSNQIFTWGLGTSGQIGNATITSTNSTPITTFAGGTNWADTATTEPEDLYTLSAGGSHTAAIKTDGTLWSWGLGSNGRLGNSATTNRSTPLTTFTGGTDWKQVSTGSIHTAAIKTDGTLWIWGSGSSGSLGNEVTIGNISTPVTTFAGGTNWKQISAGNTHTAAIKTDGTLWTWGVGSWGQIGNNQLTNISTPVTTFAGGTNWKQVDAGNTHTAAIKTDGTLWTWGDGTYGRLGTNVEGRFMPSLLSTPVTTFAGGTNWADTATTEPEDLYTLSAGSLHASAIKTDGTLWTWGNGTLGALGNADTTNISTPITTFTGGTNWKQVSNSLTTAPSSHSAIKTDGTLWTWGNGSQGRLGNATTTTINSTPVTTFAGGTNWKQISCGGYHTSAIKTDGTLWTWGFGGNGQLGNAGTTLVNSTPITTFAGGTNWKQVSGGLASTLALRDDGVNKELFAWGLSNTARLGLIFFPSPIRSTPITTFAGGTNWKQVSAGLEHTASIKTDGTLWTWGYGFKGELGTNNLLFKSTPVTTFAGGTNWKQVSAGDNYTVALNGTELFLFGLSINGKIGNSIVQTDSIASPGEPLPSTTNWKQVSAGKFSSSAVKTDGTLWTWGRGNYGELGTNDTTIRSTPVTTFAGGTNWKQVSVGSQHTTAIKTDGTLWVWGNGTDVRLGTNDTTLRSTPVTTFAGGTDWKQVSAGGSNTVAIKVNGTLWTWGNGGSGRLGNAVTTNASTPVTTFIGGNNWRQVNAGESHSLALTYNDPVL